jgi:ribosomal protein S8
MFVPILLFFLGKKIATNFKSLQQLFCSYLKFENFLTNFEFVKLDKTKKNHTIPLYAYNKNNQKLKKSCNLEFSTPNSFPRMVAKW